MLKFTPSIQPNASVTVLKIIVKPGEWFYEDTYYLTFCILMISFCHSTLPRLIRHIS